MEQTIKKQWFNDKSIAIVGNSKQLLSCSHGESIDSHDVICRINRAFKIVPPKTNKYIKSYGKRTDFLFVNLIRTSGHSYNINEMGPYKIIQTTPCGVPPKYSKTISAIIDISVIKELSDELSKKPSTGLRILYLISKLNPKSVDVYGFDWKQKAPSFYGHHDDWSASQHDFEEEQEFCHQHFFSKDNWKLIE